LRAKVKRKHVVGVLAHAQVGQPHPPIAQSQTVEAIRKTGELGHLRMHGQGLQKIAAAVTRL
jgi:ABC-type uncharacterized transport system auxiliary subunit